MDLCCELVRATSEEIRLLLAHPEEIEGFLAGGKLPPHRRTWWERLFGRKGHGAEHEWQPRPTDARCDLDRSWDVLRFLLRRLTANAPGGPTDLLALGTTIGSKAAFCGPATVLEPGEVARLAETLVRFTDEQLFTEFLPGVMAEQGGCPLDEGTWNEETRQQRFREYYQPYWHELSDFVRSCAAQGAGLVLRLL